MKRKSKVINLITIILMTLIGFSMLACDDVDNYLGTKGFAGTWHSQELIAIGEIDFNLVLYFDGNNIYQDGMYFPVADEYMWGFGGISGIGNRGKYSVKDGNLFLTPTHYHGSLLLMYADMWKNNPDYNDPDFKDDQWYNESQIRQIGGLLFDYTANQLKNSVALSLPFVFNDANTITLTITLSGGATEDRVFVKQ